jgi:hypothetical protein
MPIGDAKRFIDAHGQVAIAAFIMLGHLLPLAGFDRE